MSFFRRLLGKNRPPDPPAEFTFNQRADAFWAWFAVVSEELRGIQNRKESGILPAIVSPKVNEFLPGMAWVFGPGTGESFHSFTLSGEGIRYRQILADQWLKRSPGIENWLFHASRQPADPVGDFHLREQELVFRPMEFWVTPEVDEEAEKIDLTVWHPLIGKAEERLCSHALFLMLDEVFGEFGTTRWIGSIAFGRQRLAESMPILELKEFVEESRKSRGWKMTSPIDSWGSYSIAPEMRNSVHPRSDTIAGTSRCWPVLRSYFREPATFVDPFLKLGATWVYLSFPSSVLPAGQEVEARSEIEEAVESALTADLSGISLGGAFGTRHAYLDFLIFDGERSISLIREVARKAGVPAETRLEFLDSGSPGRPLFRGS